MNINWKIPAIAILLGAVFLAPRLALGSKPGGEPPLAALDTLYSAYLGIQEALAKDDLVSARDQASRFLAQSVSLPAELGHGVKAKQITGDFKALAAAGEIAACRKSFSGLSDRMVLVMSEIKYGGSKAVLEFHCPMANGNKGGKWLQADESVANPYFGASMLRCGSLEKRLKAGTGKNPQGEAGATHAKGAHH